MKLEIERNFLVKENGWRASVISLSKLADGLLSNRNGTMVRVRIDDTKGLITIKGSQVCFSCPEIEYEIPLVEAKFLLLNFCGGSVYRRIRYLDSDEVQAWYVDVYQDIFEGVVTGEIELIDENEIFGLPDCLGHDLRQP